LNWMMFITILTRHQMGAPTPVGPVRSLFCIDFNLIHFR
jgi:hypothetical protein